MSEVITQGAPNTAAEATSTTAATPSKQKAHGLTFRRFFVLLVARAVADLSRPRLLGGERSRCRDERGGENESVLHT